MIGVRRAERSAPLGLQFVAEVNLRGNPTLMLNAPVPAARKVLANAGLTSDNIDLCEINVNDGAIALGHPIGVTGSMLIGTVSTN